MLKEEKKTIIIIIIQQLNDVPHVVPVRQTVYNILCAIQTFQTQSSYCPRHSKTGYQQYFVF